MLRNLTVSVAVVAVALIGLAPVAGADDPAAPVLVTAPTITGAARVGEQLTASGGTWENGVDSREYTWLRDGEVFASGPARRRTLHLADRGHRISVVVTATNGTGSTAAPESARTPVVKAGRFTVKSRPTISGARRWDHTLTANRGKAAPPASSVRYRWLRNGRPIKNNARGRKYRVKAFDYGKRLSVRVTLRRAGYQQRQTISRRTKPIDHRVRARRHFTYSVATRGTITANMKVFRREAAKILGDPRGWRAAGYSFSRVKIGGDFVLYLAQAETLPSFGYPCSSMWSCRVGSNVIINQDRWLHSSPAWNAAGLPREDYRHMVINHETGHWLGHRHASCPGRGKLAPVMMQQSKGRDGCRFNPFPLPSERWTSR